MTIDLDRYFVHSNGWWWGVSLNIVMKDGTGMVEVSLDNDMPATCYVKGLSVLESERRKGIGSSLLLLCEDIARQEGKDFIELSVEKGNDWLLGWYMRMGFRILRIEEHVFDMIKTL